MLIIATSNGFILTFRSKSDLAQTVEHLKGQLEAVEAGQLGDPPYLYAQYPKADFSASEWMDKATDYFKYRLRDLGPLVHDDEPSEAE